MENNDPIKRPADRGGRRRITDRRVRASHCDGTERRTGLRRRSGFDRRIRRDEARGPDNPQEAV